MPIETVLGPIDPSEIEWTSIHEHVYIDASVWYDPAREDAPENGEITLANHGALRWNLLAHRGNMIIDEPALAESELRDVKASGGSAIVDMTTIGLGRDVGKLPELSRRTGVHIIVGSGCYIHDSHPEWVKSISEDDLAQFFINELTVEIESTGIRSAFLGEIGTSSPITSRERKVLSAAGTAAAETGACVNVHLDGQGMYGLEAFNILSSQGVDPSRIIMGHVDEHLDLGYHREMLATGSTLAYDTFGQEYYFNDDYKDPSDDQRLALLVPLIEDGFESQLVLGCDVWTKMNLVAYGGYGYAHLFKRIVPLLKRKYQITNQQVDQMLMHNPRRLLNRH